MTPPSTTAPAISPRLFRLFRWYAHRYAGRTFHAVRVARGGPLPVLPPRPVIVIMNHPSWWDPLVGLILSSSMPPNRKHYAPIEASGLAQYRFLARLGFFGVETGTAEGGGRFARTSLNILSHPESILWITPWGEFTDPRTRPVILKDGVGLLARRLAGATIIPLAVEYPFWNDRAPEALAWFGEAIPVEQTPRRSAAEWTRLLARAIEDAQDKRAAHAQSRDPELFTTVVAGAAGVGGVYDVWRRARAFLTGASFQAEHRAGPPGDQSPQDDPARHP